MAGGNNRKDTKKKEAGWSYSRILQEVTSAYVFLMLVVYPLYFQNKYVNIGYAKWRFFSVVTFGAGAILLFVFLLSIAEGSRKRGIKGMVQSVHISVTDRFVFMYAIVVLVSTLLSPYKDLVIWGSGGWYMGLIAQLCFVLVYYFVSRYWRWEDFAVMIYLAAAFAVFFLAIIMRFRIDPLGMYKGLEEQYIINFLTTIGQTTWYSSYMVLLFPVGMFFFWFYDDKFKRIFGGIFTAVGFMTFVTQNSDSAFAAFGILIFALFWISMESNKKFKRFLEVVILGFACFKFIGICQVLFPEKAVKLDGLSVFCSQGRLAWVGLGVAIVLYFGFCWMEKKKNFDISKVKAVRGILLIAMAGCILLAVIYIGLNSAGWLPESARSDNNYLLFDEYWGNNRGLSWMVAARSFQKGGIVRKIWGCGPDGFSLYTQSFFGEELAAKWGRSVTLTCAHNEWLNALVNLGIVGAAVYIGIFVSAACRFFKRSKEHPQLAAVALSVLCYMVHNFFCYQQVVCAPVIFILMGAGESVIRWGTEKE